MIATVGLDRQQAHQIEGVGVCRIDRERVSAADMQLTVLQVRDIAEKKFDQPWTLPS